MLSVSLLSYHIPNKFLLHVNVYGEENYSESEFIMARIYPTLSNLISETFFSVRRSHTQLARFYVSCGSLTVFITAFFESLFCMIFVEKLQCTYIEEKLRIVCFGLCVWLFARI